MEEKIIVKIDHKKLKWYWEYYTGKCVACVRVPTKDEWSSIFNDIECDRAEILSVVAEEVCNQKCLGATVAITHEGLCKA